MPLFTARRSFLLGAGAVVVTGVAVNRWRPDKRSENGDLKTLTVIIDTIVPEDEFAGAVSVGVATRLEQEIQNVPRTRELVERVIPRIESRSLRQHGRSFQQLNRDFREQLLTALLDNASQVQFRRDLYRIRSIVLKDYYSTTDGQNSLAYQLPARYPAYAQT